MPRQCRVAGCCASASSRYSIYCSRHKARLRRHGAVDQDAISKTDLNPHLRLVRTRIEKNQENPLWSRLDQRWDTLIGHTRQLTASGRAMPGYERQAGYEVLKLAASVPSREIVETTLAMFLLQELEPRRFRSDHAFRTQLVRRVRGLTDLNAGTWFDDQTGKTKRAYKDLTPRAVAVLALWLSEAFGSAGIHLARLEEAEREQRQAERNAFYDALSQVI